MSGAKDLLYKGSMIKEISQNAKHLGQMWNIPSLEQEGAKNEKNPGRAVGKAAAYTAGAYLGGLLGGAGAAGGAGAEAAGETAATTAAEELAKQEALNSAQYASQQGLLSSAYSGASMAPGPGVVAPGMQNVANADTALINAGYPNMAGGKLTGLLSTGAKSPAARYAMTQGLKMMNQPTQQPMSRPPMAPQQQQPMQMMYGDSTLDEETKRKLRAAGYPV
jgi:hypothetical protein